MRVALLLAAASLLIATPSAVADHDPELVNCLADPPIFGGAVGQVEQTARDQVVFGCHQANTWFAFTAHAAEDAPAFVTDNVNGICAILFGADCL